MIGKAACLRQTTPYLIILWGGAVLLGLTYGIEPKRAVPLDVPFGGPVVRGPIATDYIPEASGLEMSRMNPGILWTHNDSGDSARVFALDTLGNLIQTFQLRGLKPRDCEDITLGKGPQKNRDYLYLADMGDNRAVRKQKIIYRFLEPSVTRGEKLHHEVVTEFDSILFRYPDGKRDAEALMQDPRSGDFFIITKREDKVRLYRMKYPFPINKQVTLEFIQNLNFNLVTASDISPGGDEILVKTYQAVFYWKLLKGESIPQALHREPLQLPYIPEAQGEGICWASNEQGYYTLSEIRYKVMPDLKFYPRQIKK